MSAHFAHPDTAETRLALTFFVVEATSFEHQALWAQHAEDSIYPPWNKRKNCRAYEPLKWEQINDGWGVNVGHLDKRPICISVNWARIEDQLVMFWYPTSVVVDIAKCEAWIAAHFKRQLGGPYSQSCDANNFGHCINAINEANKVTS